MISLCTTNIWSNFKNVDISLDFVIVFFTICLCKKRSNIYISFMMSSACPAMQIYFKMLSRNVNYLYFWIGKTKQLELFILNVTTFITAIVKNHHQMSFAIKPQERNISLYNNFCQATRLKDKAIDNTAKWFPQKFSILLTRFTNNYTN